MAAGLVLGALTGCTPPPAPEPTPTFAGEEEAFAAAEATYRAYVDALNAVDLSDPETFEDVYAWTTGDANAEERRSLTQMHADGWRVSGSSTMSEFFGDKVSVGGSVTAVVCSDVSGVAVVDSDGESMVSPDRPAVYALSVVFESSRATDTGLVISASSAIEDERCADS